MSRAIVPAGTRSAANALHFFATRKGAARCTRRQLSRNRELWRSSPCGDERPQGFVGSPAGCRIENLRYPFCTPTRLLKQSLGVPAENLQIFRGVTSGACPGFGGFAALFAEKRSPCGRIEKKKRSPCGRIEKTPRLRCFVVRPQGFEPGTH